MTESSARLAASLADRYRIERELGAGGMATVYLAEDLKHHRKVAIKALHAELSAMLGPERFLKEIELTANLQHPHILPLFDSGSADGLLYYVMPYVGGETLRARLDRDRQLPIADAVRIATEAADALAYAHGRGVVHRDIKPENILLQNGHALVADFGIALAVQQAGGQRMTQTGLSLGTPQYMSPEQAMGERDIGPRSDIYSLGAVTYEMLSGDPPFSGSTAQAIVAQVITSEPRSLTTQRKSVPAHVNDAVLTALEKLPADRFATAAQFATALTNDSFSAGTGSTQRRDPGRTGWRARVRQPAVIALGALAAGFAIGAAALWRRPASDPFPLRVELPLPPAGALSGLPALSADGHTIVYAAAVPSDDGAGALRGQTTNLYLRRLDQLTSHAIPNTRNAGLAAFSPDGKSIAVIVNRRKLVRVPLDGGPDVALADVPDDGGVDWSSNGDIVIGGGAFEELKGLYRIPAAGGALVPLTRVNTARKEHSHEYPRVLSDGNTVLFTIWYGTVDRAELAVTSLDDGGKVSPLGVLAARALGVVDGQLVYVRADGTMMAVPFDVGRRRVSGTPVQVLDSVRMIGAETGYAAAYLTQSGGLVYATGTLNRRLVWVDHDGVTHDAFGEPREFNSVRLSPDGRQAALGIGTGFGNDLWVLDVAAGTLSPLTTTGRSRNPNWSPDGRRVLYASTQSGEAALWWQPADGSGPAVMAGVPHHNPWFVDLSPDGRTAVFNAIYNGTFNVETFSLDPAGSERDVSASPVAREVFGRFSPDGRYIAYNSDESGRPEVYVRLFPEGGSRIQVSTGGGLRPVWSPDGNTLYYWAGSRMMSAALLRGAILHVASRKPLFDEHYEPDYDVSHDGSQFLMIESETAGLQLVVIPNWLTELRQLTVTRKH
jgi:serine/threonine-protein kinase